MISKSKRIYTVILLLSLVLFLIKGIQYAFLGSYLPIILSGLISLLFYINREKKKVLNFLLKTWALLIIAWSLLRIFISIMDHFVKELMENHLQENLGISGTLISILFLVIGLLLFRKKRRKAWLS